MALFSVPSWLPISFSLAAKNSPDLPFSVPAEAVIGAFEIAGLLLWLWLAWGVAASWHDPAARVLRFSSSFLLLFAAAVMIGARLLVTLFEPLST